MSGHNGYGKDPAAWYSDAEEQAVIGSALHHPDSIDLMPLDPLHFYREKNQRLWRAIKAMRDRGDAIDVLSVARAAEGEAIENILDLTHASESDGWISALAPHHARTVLGLAHKRAAYQALHNAQAGLAAVQPLEAMGYVGRVESDLFELRAKQGPQDSEVVSAKTALRDCLGGLEDRMRTKAAPWIATGLPNLDQIIGGLTKRKVALVGGRPSMGKSVLVQGIALHAAKCGSRVYVATLEDDRGQWITRALSALSGVPLSAIRTGDVGDRGFELIFEAADDLSAWPLTIDDTPRQTVAQIRAKVRLLSRSQPLDLVVIDYAQLLRSTAGKRFNSRESEVAEISGDLVALAKDSGCALLVAAQLNRTSEARKDKRPALSDLRESGAWEQDAYQAILVHREGFSNPQARQDEAELIVAKNKDGRTGVAHVGWEGSCVRFVGR